jgi:hypothetical protein
VTATAGDLQHAQAVYGDLMVRHAGSRVLALLCLAAWPGDADAQRQQLWATGTIEWLQTDRLTSRVEVEPQTNPATLDVTPRVAYTVVAWADLLAEVQLEHKADSDPTATPRIGAELHILSRLLRAHASSGAEREKPPLRRVVVSTLLRFENTSSGWQFRDRFNLTYPFNRHKTTDDGAVYATADEELFVPLDRAPGAALVNQVRIRAGLGYRLSFAWRFETLYVWNGTRHAASGPLTTQSNVIDTRVTREF